MSTQRLTNDQVISSGSQGSTERGNDTIISSTAGSPKIISSSLGDEINLNGNKYDIVSLIARSGEAEIFLISQDGSKFVFKYYYPQFKPKDEILKKLKGLKHPDIISLIDYGFYQERFFEISEYAQGGTLAEIMPVNSFQKIKEIVAEILGALNYCHNHGIIHRDIKPENIFFRTSDKRDIAIGDFGIASNVKEGEEYVQTTLARTSLYAAPELFMNSRGKTTIEKSVDYYALGMSLLHLWFGRNPFEDAGGELAEMRLKSEGRVKFPGNIDKNVEKLIKGLITVNPLDRWSYDEVKRWLGGEDVKVNFKTIELQYKPYPFGMIDMQQIVVDNPRDLASYLEKYPEKGEGHLYRNTIAKWIEPVDPGLYNDLMDIVEKEYPRDRAAGLAKAIYILDTERVFRGFDKTHLSTQEEIALHFEHNFGLYKEDLQNRNAAFFVFLEARNFKEEADEFRGYFKSTNAEAALNTIILKLQGSDRFLIGDYTIYQPEELLRVDIQTKNIIINQLSNINSKLSLWIASFPELHPTIDKWRSLKRYDEITLCYALQDGFRLNGSVVGDTKEFKRLFLDNYPEFFANKNAKNVQYEADYWLKNYAGSSLQKILVEILLTESFAKDKFIKIFNYIFENAWIGKILPSKGEIESALKNYSNKKNNIITGKVTTRLKEIEDDLATLNSDRTPAKTKDVKYIAELEKEKKSLINQINKEGNIKNEKEFENVKIVDKDDGPLGVYQLITLLLPIIKEESLKNPGILDKLVEITKDGVEKEWTEELQSHFLWFIDCINFFLDFLEQHFAFFEEFFKNLVLKLNGKISENLQNDIKNTGGNENQYDLYQKELKKIIIKLTEINPDLPYLKRKKNEVDIINHKNRCISRVTATEKQNKIDFTNKKYDELVHNKREEYKLSSDKEYKNKINWSVAIGIASFILFIFSLTNESLILGIISIVLAIAAAGMALLLLAEADAEGGVVFLLVIGAGVLGWFLGSKIPIEVIYVISLGSAVFFGIRIYWLSQKRNNAIDSVSLDEKESEALKKSLEEVSRYFMEKESKETFQEEIRIMTLGQEQFEKELSELNSLDRAN